MRARVPIVSFLAGASGGFLACGAIVGVVAASGGLGGASTTVTVQQTPIVVANRSSAGTHASSVAAAVYSRAATGVVFVNASGVTAPRSSAEYIKGEGGEQATATGSGFEIDDRGTVVTNWHVVAEASKITVTVDHGHTVAASVIGKDPSTDIAVLRIPIGALPLHTPSRSETQAWPGLVTRYSRLATRSASGRLSPQASSRLLAVRSSPRTAPRSRTCCKQMRLSTRGTRVGPCSTNGEK